MCSLTPTVLVYFCFNNVDFTHSVEIGAICYSNLPGFGTEDTEQIDKDIKGAKTWIEKKSKEFDEQTKVTDKVKTVKDTVKDKVKDAKEKVQEKYEDAKDEL